MTWPHLHPAGLRFRRGETRQESVDFTLSIYRGIEDASASKGWASWLDWAEGSKDYGRWVLLNLKTHQTYIQSGGVLTFPRSSDIQSRN